MQETVLPVQANTVHCVWHMTVHTNNLGILWNCRSWLRTSGMALRILHLQEASAMLMLLVPRPHLEHWRTTCWYNHIKMKNQRERESSTVLVESYIISLIFFNNLYEFGGVYKLVGKPSVSDIGYFLRCWAWCLVWKPTSICLCGS